MPITRRGGMGGRYTEEREPRPSRVQGLPLAALAVALAPERSRPRGPARAPAPPLAQGPRRAERVDARPHRQVGGARDRGLAAPVAAGLPAERSARGRGVGLDQ